MLLRSMSRTLRENFMKIWRPVFSLATCLYFFPSLIWAVAEWISTMLLRISGLSAHLERRSEMWSMRLAGNTGHTHYARNPICAPSHTFVGLHVGIVAYLRIRHYIFILWFLLSSFLWPPYVIGGHYILPCNFYLLLMVALCNRADHYIFAL